MCLYINRDGSLWWTIYMMLIGYNIYIKFGVLVCAYMVLLV